MSKAWWSTYCRFKALIFHKSSYTSPQQQRLRNGVFVEFLAMYIAANPRKSLNIYRFRNFKRFFFCCIFFVVVAISKYASLSNYFRKR